MMNFFTSTLYFLARLTVTLIFNFCYLLVFSKKRFSEGKYNLYDNFELPSAFCLSYSKIRLFYVDVMAFK